MAVAGWVECSSGDTAGRDSGCGSRLSLTALEPAARGKEFGGAIALARLGLFSFVDEMAGCGSTRDARPDFPGASSNTTTSGCGWRISIHVVTTPTAAAPRIARVTPGEGKLFIPTRLSPISPHEQGVNPTGNPGRQDGQPIARRCASRARREALSTSAVRRSHDSRWPRTSLRKSVKKRR
jgi:hypothetical protein